MKSLNKEILRLALPSILANITVPLVGMVDIAVAGHLASSSAALIGGISIGSLMFDILYWSLEFLRAGTGGLTSQAYGRQDSKECGSILVRGMSLAFLISMGVLILQYPIQALFMLFIHCPDEVKRLALEYFYIRIWAAPATLVLIMVKGWFIGMQDSVSSMFTDLVVNGINILASIFLAMGIPWTGFRGYGFPGVAWGTVIAQYSGLIFASIIVLAKYRKFVATGFQSGAAGSLFRGGSIRQFRSVNSDLFIRSFCLIVIYLAFTSISSGFGVVLLAVCSIMMKLLMIFSYFTDGFAFAGEAMTGKYIGMKEPLLVRQTVKWVFVWSMGIGMSFVGIYTLTGIPLFRLMTSDSTVIQASREFIPWLAVMPLVGCPAFTWDGIYTGATATKALRNSAIGCVCMFFLTWFLGERLLQPQGTLAVHLLFAAYFSHLIYRSVYQTVKYRKSILGTIS